MPPKPTNDQKAKLAANLKLGRERREKAMNAARESSVRKFKETKFMKFDAPPKPSMQKAGQNVNFSRYANELLAEKGWLGNGHKNNKTSYKIPPLASANFKNTVTNVVRRKHARNHPQAPTLNDDSMFVQIALRNIEKKLEKLHAINNSKPNRSSPPADRPKPTARAVNGAVIPRLKKLQTQRLLEQRKGVKKPSSSARCQPVGARPVAKAVRPPGRPPAPCNTFPATSARCFKRRFHPFPEYRCVCEGPSPKKRAVKAK
jgi:hypothetical protein